MAINVSDLPPQYQAQALQKWKEQQARRGASATGPPKGTEKRETKYHNKPTERVTPSGAVLHFDSQKEARRYDFLIERERAGQIQDLRLQVDFTLQEAYTDTEGRRVRAIRYKADFVYKRPTEVMGVENGPVLWVLVVEDVKSKPTRTKEYAIKRKMLKDRFGFDITEV